MICSEGMMQNITLILKKINFYIHMNRCSFCQSLLKHLMTRVVFYAFFSPEKYLNKIKNFCKIYEVKCMDT